MLKAIHRLWKAIKQLVKQHTRPTTTVIAIGSLADMKRSRWDLIIENAILRQQITVLKRQVMRPQLTQGDRVRVVACYQEIILFTRLIDQNECRIQY